MKKKLFLDTNIAIDFLSERKGFYENAAKVISLADRGEVVLCCSSLTYANANYILSRIIAKTEVRAMLCELSQWCEVSQVGVEEVKAALHSSFSDFEDALQYYSALNAGADAIITRNKKDFLLAEIPVLEPQELFL